MMALAVERNIAVLNAAPYAGGVFAKGTTNHARYVYQEADAATLEPVRAIEALCEAHNVPPGALALQFSMRDPRVVSTICGVSKPERVEQTLSWAHWPIPDTVWAALETVAYSNDDPEATRIYQPD